MTETTYGKCPYCSAAFTMDHLCKGSWNSVKRRDVCEHGNLRDKCERCDDAATIDRLKGDLDRAREDGRKSTAEIVRLNEAQAGFVKSGRRLERAHQAETIAKLPPTGRRCCDKATVYWRQQYQAEANENTAIREALGISAEDSDETLTSKAVTKTIARIKRERDEARAEVKRLRAALVEVREAYGSGRPRRLAIADRALVGAQEGE